MTRVCPVCGVRLSSRGVVYLLDGELLHVACALPRTVGDAVGAAAEQGAHEIGNAAAAAVRDAIRRRRG